MVKTADEKLKQLGKVYPIVLNENVAPFAFDRFLDQVNDGIVVANENLLTSVDRVVSDGGNVGPQAVDLEAMTGNPQVLGLVGKMMSKPGVTFFPGTLMRDFGGYFLCTMPVIRDGKIVMERVKQTGDIYTDGRGATPDLVRRAEDLKNLPMRPLDINGLRVLPVICNELSLVPVDYSGDPVDVIVHSCEQLFMGPDAELRRLDRYTDVLSDLDDLGRLNGPTVVVTAERGDPSYKGILVYEDGKLRKVD